MNAPTDRPQHARSETLGFVAPGLAHQLGNALFAVQGHAALLRSQEPEFLRERNGMLAAIERAEQALQVLQFLVGLEGRGPQQPGILLHRLAEMLRVSLREASLALELGHGSRQTPRPVAPAPFCRGVLAAVRHLTQAVRSAGAGSIRLDLTAQHAGAVSVQVEWHPPKGALPFPVDIGSCAVAVQREVAAEFPTLPVPLKVGLASVPRGVGLQLTIPTVGSTLGVLPQPSDDLHGSLTEPS